MTILLDTSVLIGIENGHLLAGRLVEPAVVSAVTLEELFLGVLRAEVPDRGPRRRTFDQASHFFVALPVDAAVARTCAEIRAAGRARGRRYQLADSLIGATARVHGLALVTQDEGMLGMLGVDVQVL